MPFPMYANDYLNKRGKIHVTIHQIQAPFIEAGSKSMLIDYKLLACASL